MVLNFNSDWAILITGMHFIGHESFLHDFNIQRVSWDKSVAFVINTGHNVCQLIVQDFDISFGVR
jgi:hypothetical protein